MYFFQEQPHHGAATLVKKVVRLVLHDSQLHEITACLTKQETVIRHAKSTSGLGT